MEEYFNSYSSVFKFAALVVAVVATLILITSLLNKYLFRKKRMSWAHDLTPAFNFAQRLLNALWIVLGLIAISFIFVDEGKYGLLNENFKLVLYLGVLSVLTIVLASTLNLWFKKAIDRKIQDEEDPTNYKFIRYVAVFGVYVTG